MNSLKSRLLNAKQKLTPTETHVITPDGRETIERRDADGNTVTTATSVRHWGFVGDLKPDMQLAQVELGLFIGASFMT